jgi:hypothetical protein
MVNLAIGPPPVGTLHWTMVLDDELDAASKATELECKRSELKKLAPDVHSRMIKANVFRRLRDLASMFTGAAAYM